MKSSQVWICILWGASLWACSFDRSPLAASTTASQTSERSAAMVSWSAAPSVGDRDASSLRSGDGTSSKREDAGDQNGAGKNSGATSDMRDTGGGSKDEDGGAGPQEPAQVPIRCKEQYCPLASAPVKACCTTQDDVTRHGARAVEACGVDLSALDGMSYGSGCWQRDQLGIIDGRCPSRGEEPGCCADDGLCGTNNAAQHLGCFHASTAEPRACRRGMGGPMASACNPRGSYALRVSVDAAWDGRDSGLAALTDDGRGTIEIYLLIHVEDVDASSNEVQASGHVCGVSLPAFFSSTLCESYVPSFPDRIWESPALPVPQLSGHYECAADGCVLSLLPTTYLFGIRLQNPEARWPTPQQTPYLRCPDLPRQSCFPDDDDDGLPGITIQIATEGSAMTGGSCRAYAQRGAPLNDTIAAIFNGVRRADRLQVGIRARVGGSVRFGDNCETAAGSALVEYVNSRASGCYVEPGTFNFLPGGGQPAGPNEPCSRDEADFIDLSMPEYRVLSAGEQPGTSRSNRDNKPSPGPTVSVVRFESGATPDCAAVREAMFSNHGEVRPVPQ